jgi:cytochrome c553
MGKSVLFLLLLSFVLSLSTLPGPLSAAENECVNCHGRPETISFVPDYQQEIFGKWSSSIHGLTGITCEKCMGGDPTAKEKGPAHKEILPSSDPESQVYYKNIPKLCGSCHTAQYTQFINSKHYKRLSGDQLAPVCSTCHGSYDVGVVNPLLIAKKCSICHNTISGIDPTIPDEAKRVLNFVGQAKTQIIDAEMAIRTARGKGTDVSEAERNLRQAKEKLEKSAGTWHAFDLTAFEREVLDASYLAKQAERIAVETAEPEREEKGICGPTILLLLALTPFALRRRRR